MEVIWALSKSLACSRGLVKNFTFPIIEQTNHNISPTLLSGYINMKNRFRNKTLHFLRLGLILLVCVLSSLEIFSNCNIQKKSIWKMLLTIRIAIWFSSREFTKNYMKKKFHLLFMLIFVTADEMSFDWLETRLNTVFMLKNNKQ